MPILQGLNPIFVDQMIHFLGHAVPMMYGLYIHLWIDHALWPEAIAVVACAFADGSFSRPYWPQYALVGLAVAAKRCFVHGPLPLKPLLTIFFAKDMPMTWLGVVNSYAHMPFWGLKFFLFSARCFAWQAQHFLLGSSMSCVWLWLLAELTQELQWKRVSRFYD